ncbi:T-cell activation Rho GTPase-activating protein-like [Rhea pennata]|uniref:T-cell activation Rho GTPase-activating protein-like n=1 Tax=Rhea pennata TaxID=8795 RepID=UPI002E2610F4
MGQANCCGTRGAAGPAADARAQPGAPGPTAPGARRGLGARAAARPPPPLPALVSSGSPQLLLALCAQVTRHGRMRRSHLLLFPHALAIAAFKCSSTFWLKHRVRLSELWVLCSEEVAAARPDDEEEVFGLRCSRTLVLVWPTNLCVVTFGSQEAEPGSPGSQAHPTALPAAPRQGRRLLRTRKRPRAALSAPQRLGFPNPAPDEFLTAPLCSLAQEVSLTAATVETLLAVEADARKCPRLEPSDTGGGLGRSAAEAAEAGRPEISWPLARRGTSASRDSPGQLRSGAGAALFGQPLAAICADDGGLPQPVRDLLAVLYGKGPATEGVFRKKANEKAGQELKEVLSQGENADLDSRPVPLVAVVLKDFLRSIPSKLLSDHLYDDWMLALEKPSQQAKIDSLKEVAGSLPTANLLLLQRLFAVLHHISENVETSGMDASNLAVCVGPSMLSPGADNALSLAAQERSDKVTALVEFLIDNCRAIFGEDISLPFSRSAEESPEDTGSSTEHAGAPEHSDSAWERPEPGAVGSRPALEMEQPSGRSSSANRPCPSCASAPPLSPFTSGISSVDRRFSEPRLSFHSRCEGRPREQEPSKRAGNFPIRQ